MIDKQLVHDTVVQALEGTDRFLTNVTITPDNVITVEIDSMTGVDIDTCAMLTRKIESVLDRDTEDFELEVGSAGLTSPFKVIRQYEKNIGNEVEVLTNDGRKLHGTLTGITPDGTEFTITVAEKVKEPGKKRPVITEKTIAIAVSDTKYVKYSINFK